MKNNKMYQLASVVGLLFLSGSAFAGEDIVVDGLRLYVAEPGAPLSGSKAIVWAPDNSGFHGGRIRELADRLASETEYVVWIELNLTFFSHFP